jgi:hypothetical protein
LYRCAFQSSSLFPFHSFSVSWQVEREPYSLSVVLTLKLSYHPFLVTPHPLHYPSNIFSNPYVFPPILFIPCVLRYLLSLSLPFTMVIPVVLPDALGGLLYKLRPTPLFFLVSAVTQACCSSLQSMDFHLIHPYLGTWAFWFQVDVSQHFNCGI